MNRINIYSISDDNYAQDYQGWFDLDASSIIAEITTSTGGPYKSGKILRATAKGKLIINDWNNSGYDTYRFATSEEEIAEILAGGNADDLKADLAAIMAKYEL